MGPDNDIEQMLAWCEKHPDAVIEASPNVLTALKAQMESAPPSDKIAFMGLPIRANKFLLDDKIYLVSKHSGPPFDLCFLGIPVPAVKEQLEVEKMKIRGVARIKNIGVE